MVVLAAGEPEQTLLKAGELVETARKVRILASGRCDGIDSNHNSDRVLGPETAIHIVLAGEAPKGLALTIADEFEDAVTAMILPEIASWDLLAIGLETWAKEICPAMVMFSHTAMAREVGPALAVALGGVSVSNVCAVDRYDNGFLFTRPVMDNSRVQGVRVPHGQLCIISLAPGAAVAEGRSGTQAVKMGSGEKLSKRGRVRIFRPPASPGPSLERISLTARSAGGDGKLSRAPVVVAAGRGIGEPANLDRVRAFAACFPGAATAASRPLVDQGWVGYDRQVGITGAVVAPELYIALGISGSSQHLAGMAGSKWVISVNHSGDAPICRHCDLCIQADVTVFMDAVLKSRKKQ